MGEKAQEVVWRPQPGPQTALVSCPVFDVFYGGARGGGKTDAMIGGDWPAHAGAHGEHAKGIFFRRTMPQLEAAIERSKQLYPLLGAEWAEQKKQWRFPGGAVLKFRHLEKDKDAELYQGHDYTRLYFEELTNYPSADPVDKLKATLRSAHGVPCGFRATGNPGGPGHQWVKKRYIDPAPSGYKVLRDEHGLDRVFIPAKLDDNPALTESDPMYVARLRQTGSEKLVAKWLDGDWSVIEGAFFDCWRADLHVIPPFAVPDDWPRFRSLDWGSAKPFSVGWWAIVPDAFRLPDGRVLPRGFMLRYREWYGCVPDQPDTGLKMTAEKVGAGIDSRSKGERYKYSVADPATFAEDGGPSIISRIGGRQWRRWKKADNKRTSRPGKKPIVGGWDMMRQRLEGEAGVPMIGCFSTCSDSIRTIPELTHDDTNAEDLDTNMEDHAADEWRYACMSKPWKPKDKVTPIRRREDRYAGGGNVEQWKVV